MILGASVFDSYICTCRLWHFLGTSLFRCLLNLKLNSAATADSVGVSGAIPRADSTDVLEQSEPWACVWACVLRVSPLHFAVWGLSSSEGKPVSIGELKHRGTCSQRGMCTAGTCPGILSCRQQVHEAFLQRLCHTMTALNRCGSFSKRMDCWFLDSLAI